MPQSQPDYARLPVQPATRDKVRAAKQGSETYDDVLNRLLREADAVPASQPSDAGND